jgi:hypothetical protein
MRLANTAMDTDAERGALASRSARVIANPLASGTACFSESHLGEDVRSERNSDSQGPGFG